MSRAYGRHLTWPSFCHSLTTHAPNIQCSRTVHALAFQYTSSVIGFAQLRGRRGLSVTIRYRPPSLLSVELHGGLLLVEGAMWWR